MIDSAQFRAIVVNFARRIHAVETRDIGPMTNTLWVALPTPSVITRGRLRYVTNGRKIGEGAGGGTGVLVYDDGVSWRRASDDTVAVA